MELPKQITNEAGDQSEETKEKHKDVGDIHSQAIQGYQLTHDRSRREVRPSNRYGFTNMVYYALIVAKEINVLEPITYHQAITSKYSSKWISAMQDDIDRLC